MYPSPARKINSRKDRGFTLIELLVVIAIVAILAVVVIITLNPAALLQQSRDSNRLSDVGTLTSAMNLYGSENVGNGSLGTPGVLYISIPDPTATTTAGTNCAGVGLSGNYHCAASSTYRAVNGNGWVPVNLTNLNIQPPLPVLPVDPTNTTSSGEYYEYETNGTSWEFAAYPESQKYSSQAANFAKGSSQSLIVLGSSAGIPTFSPASGTYNFCPGMMPVIISSVTTGASICYTTDGSTPTANGAGSCTHGIASSSVQVDAGSIVNAIASRSGYTDSAVASATYTQQSGGCGL